MRKIIALLTIFSLNAYAVAPTGVGGEQGALSYTNNLKAPNYQVTSLGGVNSRVETGNTNLLMNPSFEHTTVYTGWTINGGTAPPFTNATVTENITNQVEGKKAISIAPSAALTFGQDSTVNAANLTGLQGVASVKIKATGTTGLKVCPRNAGAAVTNLCVNVTADNTWKYISIPFILGVTSNGIGIATTATGGTVIVDDAFVGTSAPFQDVSGARLMGTVTFTACASAWSTTSTTFADFATQTGCTVSTTGSATNTTGTGLSTIPKIQFSSLPAGDYRVEYEGAARISASAGSDLFLQFSDGTNTAREISTLVGTAGSTYANSNTVSQTISYSTAQSNVTLSLKAKVQAGATGQLFGQTTYPGVIKLYYFPPASKIYSQASQDYDWTAYTPTFTGFGTVSPASSQCFHKRDGSDLSVSCSFATGTTTAVLASMTLPSGLSIDSNKIVENNTTLAQGQVVGYYSQQQADGWGNIVTAKATSTSLVYLGMNNSTTGRLTPSNGSAAFFNSQTTSINFKVPISGWSDYGVIVGSFAGIEKCANDYECTDTFSAKIDSSGIVTGENLEWINGNCTQSSGTYTCNFVSGIFTVAPTCMVAQGVYTGGHAVNALQTAETSTQLNYLFAAGALRDARVICIKQGQDYKPKTAKVASSIGVPTVPGITTQAIDTFSVSYGTTNATTVCSASPCSYLDQIGTMVSSVTRSGTGAYNLNVNKTYSKLKCTASGNSRIISDIQCSNCSSVAFASQNTVGAADSLGVINCQGSY